MQHLTLDSPIIGISGATADSRSVQAMMACVQEAGRPCLRARAKTDARTRTS